MFKRRTPKSWALWLWHFIWPQGGWARAFYYVRHRVNRLPDNPNRIARGVFVGIFTSFTPFYGLHFVIAALFARVINGNILAALMATFFGNPLTYVPIGLISLQTGHFLLGTRFEGKMNLGRRFQGAWHDLRDNFIAIFTSDVAHWGRLHDFYSELFYPYMIGGLIPGVVFGLIGYLVSEPLIRAYQNRRKGRLKSKIEEIRARKAMKKAGENSAAE